MELELRKIGETAATTMTQKARIGQIIPACYAKLPGLLTKIGNLQVIEEDCQMLKKIEAYKTSNGVVEDDPLSAAAWELAHRSDNHLNFSQAFWVINNSQLVYDLALFLVEEITNNKLREKNANT